VTTTKELQVRRAAARHLTGIPARQNAAAIDHLETVLALEELHARVGAEEIARWERMDGSVFA
jgi:hypothetical protein